MSKTLWCRKVISTSKFFCNFLEIVFFLFCWNLSFIYHFNSIRSLVSNTFFVESLLCLSEKMLKVKFFNAKDAFEVAVLAEKALCNSRKQVPGASCSNNRLKYLFKVLRWCVNNIVVSKLKLEKSFSALKMPFLKIYIPFVFLLKFNFAKFCLSFVLFSRFEYSALCC